MSYTTDAGGLLTTNNRLNYVDDAVTTTTAYTDDIDDQAAANYTYDAIGNLVADFSEKNHDALECRRQTL